MENFFTHSLKNISQSESNSNMKYKYKLVMNCTEIVKILYPRIPVSLKKKDTGILGWNSLMNILRNILWSNKMKIKFFGYNPPLLLFRKDVYTYDWKNTISIVKYVFFSGGGGGSGSFCGYLCTSHDWRNHE